jgi:hypothetical protein
MLAASSRPCFSRVGRFTACDTAFAKRPSFREADEELDHALAQLGRAPLVARGVGERLRLGDAIEALRLARQLGDHPEAMGPPEQELIAPVGETPVLGHDSCAAHLVERRIAGELVGVLGAHRDHADATVARERVRSELAVARLEHVQRNRELGQEHDVLEREERELRARARAARRAVLAGQRLASVSRRRGSGSEARV